MIGKKAHPFDEPALHPALLSQGPYGLPIGQEHLEQIASKTMAEEIAQQFLEGRLNADDDPQRLITDYVVDLLEENPSASAVFEVMFQRALANAVERFARENPDRILIKGVSTGELKAPCRRG